MVMFTQPTNDRGRIVTSRKEAADQRVQATALTMVMSIEYSFPNRHLLETVQNSSDCYSFLFGLYQ